MTDNYMTVETTNLEGCSCFSLQSAADIQNGAVVGKGDLIEGEKSIYAALDAYENDSMFLVANPAWSYKNDSATDQNEEKFINKAGIAFRAYELKPNRKYKVANLPSAVTLAKGDYVEFKNGAYAKASAATSLKVVDVEETGFPYCIGSAGVTITGDTKNEYGYAIETRVTKYTIEVLKAPAKTGA
ncbi:MAG: hypothetical protein K1W19_03200 [Lachnospiraceae bacterium]